MEWILIIVGLVAVGAIVWYVLNGRVEGDAHVAGSDATQAPATVESAPRGDADAPVIAPAVESAPAPAHAGAHVAPSPAVDAPAAEVVRDAGAYDDVVVHEADDAADLIDVPDDADHAARIDEAAAQLAGASSGQEPRAGRRFENAPAAEPLAEPERVAQPDRVVEPEATPQRVVAPEPVVESVVAPQPISQPVVKPVVEPAPVVEPEPTPQRVVEAEPARRLAEPTDADVEQVWDGPFGPGSAEAGPHGEGPRGWTIKGARQTKVYLTPDIPVFNSAKANVWFVDEQRAIDAGFHRWDAPQG